MKRNLRIPKRTTKTRSISITPHMESMIEKRCGALYLNFSQYLASLARHDLELASKRKGA